LRAHECIVKDCCKHTRASSSETLTSFSLSPLYFDVSVDPLTLKKVVPHSVATAFALQMEMEKSKSIVELK
jgi:hypothetical protein